MPPRFLAPRTQEPERQLWQLTPAAKQLGNGKLGKMKLKARVPALVDESYDSYDMMEMNNDETMTTGYDGPRV